ncbi:hypothetical protein OJAV_G00164540 [Oryzias javanicus]|uniref:Uncharacterized protein n=1 Tax=Oryzias javanicus TaxID=123683 RepID=A0A437CK62_ORYJA|nr:hypothetical protein OJAV_G00164540 [Oryzias javanicus]
MMMTGHGTKKNRIFLEEPEALGQIGACRVLDRVLDRPVGMWTLLQVLEDFPARPDRRLILNQQRSPTTCVSSPRGSSFSSVLRLISELHGLKPVTAKQSGGEDSLQDANADVEVPQEDNGVPPRSSRFNTLVSSDSCSDPLIGPPAARIKLNLFQTASGRSSPVSQS